MNKMGVKRTNSSFIYVFYEMKNIVKHVVYAIIIVICTKNKYSYSNEYIYIFSSSFFFRKNVPVFYLK